VVQRRKIFLHLHLKVTPRRKGENLRLHRWNWLLLLNLLDLLNAQFVNLLLVRWW
jgi:hypothetical protein